MSSNSSDPEPLPKAPKRRGKAFTIGIFVLPAVALICLVLYFGIGRFKAMQSKSVTSQVPTFSELVSANGTVRLLKSGQAEWQRVTAGAHLMEGDLIQTDSNSDASIRYPNGMTVSIQAQTVFAVQRSGNNEMEILMPSEPGMQTDSQTSAAAGANAEPANQARPGTFRPSLNLQRIVPFGRSLELIGYVEPGSSLTVNAETVDVGGDGSFKHFTNPFPKSAEKVQLILKATNLAGKTSVLTATHDFNTHAGAN